jgi:hypothetical protein
MIIGGRGNGVVANAVAVVASALSSPLAETKIVATGEKLTIDKNEGVREVPRKIQAHQFALSDLEAGPSQPVSGAGVPIVVTPFSNSFFFPFSASQFYPASYRSPSPVIGRLLRRTSKRRLSLSASPGRPWRHFRLARGKSDVTSNCAAADLREACAAGPNGLYQRHSIFS